MNFYTVFATQSKTVRVKCCDIHKLNYFACSDYDLDNCTCTFKTTFKIKKYEYATNNDGSGLFLYIDGQLKQLSGNMQFNAKDKKNLLQKLQSHKVVMEPFERFFGTENGARNYLKKNNLEEIK